MHEGSLPAGPRHLVRIRWTDRHDGDFHVDAPAAELAARRRALAPGKWTWLRQVHGAGVVEVDRPGAGAGDEGDAALTSTAGAVLAVQTADCVPVVLAGEATVGVAHVGWRGLVAGVIPALAAAFRQRGADPRRALIGPCIGPGAYEFGIEDLDRVAAIAGESARGRTAGGRPALDLAPAVAGLCRAEGVEPAFAGGGRRPPDTADARWFSHRVRGDGERQVTVAWLEEAA